jgi:hypothetical protein
MGLIFCVSWCLGVLVAEKISNIEQGKMNFEVR